MSEADGPSPAFAVGRWHVAALVLLLLASAGLRFYRLDATPVWCDELLSIHLSNGHNFAVDRLPRDVLIPEPPDLMSLAGARPAWTVWNSLGGDVHPPLYYLSLRLWRECFGDSPAAIRSLSALLGTLAVGVIFLAGRELAGTAGGLWAAALNALASQHLYYSQEARMYTLALCLVGAAVWLVLRIERLGFSRARGTGLAAAALGAMLTLYLSASVLLACGLYVLIRFRGRARTATLLAFVLSGVAFAILWLPFFQPIDQAKADWLKAGGVSLRTIADRLLLLPMTHFGVLRESMMVSARIFAVAVFLLPLLVLRRSPQVLLPWLGMVAVMGMPAVADWVRSTNMLRWERYTLLLIPTLSLALVATSAALLARQRPLLRHALPAALVVFSAMSLPPTYLELSRYDFRSNARIAERARNASGGRLIFATTWNSQFNSVLLLSAQYYWKEPPREVVLVEAVEALDRLPRDLVTDRVLLVAGDLPADPTVLRDFEHGGESTWQLGVGSVHTLRRRAGEAP